MFMSNVTSVHSVTSLPRQLITDITIRCLHPSRPKLRNTMFVVEVLRFLFVPLRGCLACAAKLEKEEEDVKLESPLLVTSFSSETKQQHNDLIFGLEARISRISCNP